MFAPTGVQPPGRSSAVLSLNTKFVANYLCRHLCIQKVQNLRPWCTSHALRWIWLENTSLMSLMMHSINSYPVFLHISAGGIIGFLRPTSDTD